MEALLKAAFRDRGTRGQQKELGASEIGGCRQQTYLRLQDHPVVNDTLGLAAWMGSAVHKAIEDNLRAHDPWGDEYLTELEVTSESWPVPLKGHVDLYVPGEGLVVDWKTTTKKNLRYFPKQQAIWQVHVYADMLREAGQDVREVALVGIPRDGDERDVVVHRQGFDPAVVVQAREWLQGVVDGRVGPDNHPRFCALYCDYFSADGDGCAGKS